MLQITYSPEDLRLLEAADIAEARGGHNRYDQRSFGLTEDGDGRWELLCDSPACMLGGYAMHHPGGAAARFLIEGDSLLGEHEVFTEFGINAIEFHKIFGVRGCGNARCDGRKAAAYVRRFVEARAKARLV